MVVHPSSSAEIATSHQICQMKGAVHVTGVPLITAAPHRVLTVPLFEIGDHTPLADALALPVTNPNHQRQPILFSGTHHHPVRCALAATSMMSPTAKQQNYRTNQPPPTALLTSLVISSTRVATHCVGTFSGQWVVTAARTNTNAQDVVTKGMEQTSALALNTLVARLHDKAHTPYIANAWQTFLSASDLTHICPLISELLLNGFDVHAPHISRSFTPPNHPSTSKHPDAFQDIINKEFAKGRYIGPFTLLELENSIGPVQSSPLSIIPKPGRPGKYHLIQNLSFPHTASHGESHSINSQVDPANFPCSWGTFNTICSLITSLPPGCQGTTRDVAEAY